MHDAWPNADGTAEPEGRRAGTAARLLAHPADGDGPVPGDVFVPFGARVAAVPVSSATGRRLRLTWPAARPAGTAATFGLTVARDDREEKRVTVWPAGGTAQLGCLDVRYADPHQRVVLPLDAAGLAAALTHGVELAVTRGSSPLWIFADDSAPAGHRPALVFAGADPPLRRLLDRLCSIDSVQPFGWMEGCVLDAHAEIAESVPALRARALRAREDHLRCYLRDGVLRYGDPRGRRITDRYYGIEATLPVAALARDDPRHRAVRMAEEFWAAATDGDGCVRDTDTTAEGCYTVAYPMAVAASGLASADLAARARRQLLTRRDRLRDRGAVFLRQRPDGTRSYRNWARAFGWYLLGVARTARCLTGLVAVDDLWAEFRAVAELAVRAQRGDGLWSCYLDRPDTGPEAAGSAGIAAGLAIGAEAGQLAGPARASATRAFDALLALVTPEGLLAGCSQSNKGGEALQESGYRVLSGMAAGLLGQLAATLIRSASIRG